MCSTDHNSSAIFITSLIVSRKGSSCLSNPDTIFPYCRIPTCLTNQCLRDAHQLFAQDMFRLVKFIDNVFLFINKLSLSI